MVGVLDGDSWDLSQQFQASSQHNPNRRCSIKLPNNNNNSTSNSNNNNNNNNNDVQLEEHSYAFFLVCTGIFLMMCGFFFGFYKRSVYRKKEIWKRIIRKILRMVLFSGKICLGWGWAQNYFNTKNGQFNKKELRPNFSHWKHNPAYASSKLCKCISTPPVDTLVMYDQLRAYIVFVFVFCICIFCSGMTS